MLGTEHPPLLPTPSCPCLLLLSLLTVSLSPSPVPAHILQSLLTPVPLTFPSPCSLLSLSPSPVPVTLPCPCSPLSLFLVPVTPVPFPLGPCPQGCPQGRAVLHCGLWLSVPALQPSCAHCQLLGQRSVPPSPPPAIFCSFQAFGAHSSAGKCFSLSQLCNLVFKQRHRIPAWSGLGEPLKPVPP